MILYVYDFDKTIYDGDSTIDFYLYCLKNNKKIITRLPKQIISFIKYKLKIINKKSFKEDFLIFFKDIDNLEEVVNNFWKKNEYKIKKFFKEKIEKQDNVVIISASPEVLLKPIAKKLKTVLIASKVNKNGKFNGENCYGKEKVKRINQLYQDFTISEFYSDSYSDLPLALLSTKSYIVKKYKIESWKFDDKNNE